MYNTTSVLSFTISLFLFCLIASYFLFHRIKTKKKKNRVTRNDSLIINTTEEEEYYTSINALLLHYNDASSNVGKPYPTIPHIYFIHLLDINIRNKCILIT